MQYTVTGTQQKIDFGAAGVAEVLQNVRTILCTPIRTVPLDRAFGADLSMLDLPIPAAQAKLSAQIYGVIHRYEPRARVRKIEYIQDIAQSADGHIIPRVTVEVHL